MRPADWDSTRAARFMRAWGRSLRREADYLEENAADMSTSEEEFRLVLEHGLGFSDDAIEEACADAQLPTCRICGCTDERACSGGCTWMGPDLCSRCVGKTEEEAAGEERMRELVVGAHLVLSCYSPAARRLIARDLREGLASTLLEEDAGEHPPLAVRRSPVDGGGYGLVASLDGRVVLLRLVDGQPITVAVSEWLSVLQQLGGRPVDICPVVIRQPAGGGDGGAT